MKARSFSQALGVLIIFWLLAEIVFGLFRNPFPDRYEGDVTVLYYPKGGRFSPDRVAIENVKMQVDIIDSGYIYDRRPRVNGDGVRVKFVGENAEKLKQTKLPEMFFESAGTYFASGVCNFKELSSTSGRHRFIMGMKYPNGDSDYRSYGRTYSFEFSGKECPPMEVGILSFNEIEVLLGKTTFDNNFAILGRLERNSHINPIQRLMMWVRFDKKNVKHATLTTGW